jgi:hypothetical protein
MCCHVHGLVACKYACAAHVFSRRVLFYKNYISMTNTTCELYIFISLNQMFMRLFRAGYIHVNGWISSNLVQWASKLRKKDYPNYWQLLNLYNLFLFLVKTLLYPLNALEDINCHINAAGILYKLGWIYSIRKKNNQFFSLKCFSLPIREEMSNIKLCKFFRRANYIYNNKVFNLK